MIRHYVARRAQVTGGHPHSAADRVGLRCSVPDTVLSAGTMSGPDAEMRPRAGWVRGPAAPDCQHAGAISSVAAFRGEGSGAGGLPSGVLSRGPRPASP